MKIREKIKKRDTTVILLFKEKIKPLYGMVLALNLIIIQK
jgi:hypothetical protein